MHFKIKEFVYTKCISKILMIPELHVNTMVMYSCCHISYCNITIMILPHHDPTYKCQYMVPKPSHSLTASIFIAYSM